LWGGYGWLERKGELVGEGRRRYRNVIFDSQRWDGFEFRDDDIVISTPSKCGTTWMQMQCALLIFQDTKLPAPLTRLSPWIDVQTETVESVFAELAGQTHRRFIKTHSALDGIPHDPRVTYITVGRDPRDVALSWDNHFSNLNLESVMGQRFAVAGMDDLAELMPDGIPVPPEDPIERFWEWILSEQLTESDVTGMPGMLHHLQTFWDRRDDANIALFHYADMKADLDGEMRRLANVLGIAVDESRWDELVAAATFDRMRDRAEELAPQVTHGFWQDSSRFFHKGSSGQWVSFCDDGDIEKYEARVHELASPDLAEWVHTGWRGATV
jgi:aryl sulfotransferase